MASEQDVINFYTDHFEFLVPKKPRHERIFQGLERIHLAPGRTVLDIGCGTGVTSIYMARQGCKVTAVDLVPRSIAYAKKHRSNKNIEYLVADVTKLELGRTFDVIVMADVLEHLQPDTLGDMMTVLNSHAHQGTILYISYPIGEYMAFCKELGMFQQIIENQIPLGLVLSMLDKAGFSPMFIETYGFTSPIECYEIIMVTKERLLRVWEQTHDRSSVLLDEDVPKGTLEGEGQ